MRAVPLATTVKLTLWPAHTVAEEGWVVIAGAVLTVMEKLQDELPQELVAVHVTVVMPAAKVEPEAGEHVTVGAGVPVAVGEA